MRKAICFHKEKIALPTFNWSIWIVFTAEPEAYSRHVGNLQINEHDTTEAITMHWPQEMKCEVALKLSASHGSIAHEAWHAVRFMLVQIGVTLDSEVVAYHLGYVVNEIYSIRKIARKKLAKR